MPDLVWNFQVELVPEVVLSVKFVKLFSLKSKLLILIVVVTI